MRTMLYIWTVLFVLGGVIVGIRARSGWRDASGCEYLASRNLPEAFHLGDGDWSPIVPEAPSISGKYTRQPYQRNCRICASDMLTSPKIEANGLNPLALNVPAGPLNAGAVVDIYRNKKIVAKKVPVIAILCGVKDCSYVVAGIQDADMPAVTEGDAAPVLLIRRLP